MSITIGTSNFTGEETFVLTVPTEYDAISAPVDYSYACPKAPAMPGSSSQNRTIALQFIDIQVKLYVVVSEVCLVEKLC